jgi:hypothetical protein
MPLPLLWALHCNVLDPIALRPYGIRTLDLTVFRRTRWPLCLAALCIDGSNTSVHIRTVSSFVKGDIFRAFWYIQKNVAALRRPVLWFKKYFLLKTWRKYWLFCSNFWQFCKNMIVTLVLRKNANFFAENWEKLQKILILTSTTDCLCTFLRSTFYKHFLAKHT